MSDAEEICRQVYRETNAFYESRVKEGCGLGFKILYGPPVPRPEILFLAYQPGGGIKEYKHELELRAHVEWPKKCEYAYETWRLARKMQKMFGPDLLKDCTGLNAIFFRSPRQKEYARTFHSALRSDIEDFCQRQVKQMISAIQPRKIVVIGFKTLDLCGGGTPDLKSGAHALTKIGRVAEQEAIATIHLSSPYILNTDRALIHQHLKHYKLVPADHQMPDNPKQLK